MLVDDRRGSQGPDVPSRLATTLHRFLLILDEPTASDRGVHMRDR
jgi:hypothetical protein